MGGGGGGLVARRELIASGRDDCFSRGYADAYIYGRAQTSTSINRRDVHSHARACIRERLPRARRRFNIPIVYSYSRSTEAGLLPSGKSLRFQLTHTPAVTRAK